MHIAVGVRPNREEGIFARTLLNRAKDADARPEAGEGIRCFQAHRRLLPLCASNVRGALDTAAVLRGFLNSAKGADARRETAKELAGSSGGALDTATVLPEFLERLPAAQLNRLSERVKGLAPRLEFGALAAGFVDCWPRLRAPLFACLAGLYVVSGFYIVRPYETGVVERFGRKVLPYSGPGLHYKFPWPVDRLTKLEKNRIRVVEIGFRINEKVAASAEPAAYEWNVQHSYGRYTTVPEESLMLTGDQKMIELIATVLYRIADPEKFLFRQLDPDATIRSAAHSVLQTIVTSAPLDDVLTQDRRGIETRAKAGLQIRLDRYDAGIGVLGVRLEDVHPSQEVVDAFRQVSDAFEEKSRLVNAAQGYRNEQLALARGNAVAMLRNAEAYRTGRTHRAKGDADRFEHREAAFRGAPEATESRLYLETMEEVLPGKKKLIIDKTSAKRQLLLLEDGVELPSSLRALSQ
jgi:modulator of FtsH protease HflK